MNTNRIRNGPLRIARISRTGVVILTLLTSLLPVAPLGGVQTALATSSDFAMPAAANLSASSADLQSGLAQTTEADLRIEKLVSPNRMPAGNATTYTVTVYNDGPDGALNVSVADPLPTGVTLDSTSGCAEDPNGVPTCSLGTIASGGSASYTIKVSADLTTRWDDSPLTNAVTVSSDTTDPNTANNTATEDLTVSGSIGQCLETRSASKGTGIPLNCTTNDVRLAQYTLISGPTSCLPGEQIMVELKGQFVSTAQDRYDVGVFIHTEGGDAKSATDDKCYNDFLHLVSTTNTDLNLTGGAGPFYNAEITEDPGDMCGDISQGNDAYFTTAVISIVCADSNGDGTADVSTCTGWENSASAGTTSKPSCTSELDTYAQTKAKCTCGSVDISGLSVPKTGTLEVVKDVDPDDPTTNWVMTVTGPTPFNDTLTGDDTTGPQTVGIGNYTVVESAGSDTDLADYTTTYECTIDGDPGPSGSGTTINVAVGDDETVVCTFTNVKLGSITIIKETHPAGGTDFDFTGTGGLGSFSLDDGGSLPFLNLVAGVYDVTEDVPEDWTLKNVICTGGVEIIQNVVRISLDPGEDITCTFVNEQEPTAITLASFTAEAGADGVALAWETGTEVDNAGFNVYRAITPGGPYAKVNGALIAAEGDPVAGATYSFLDEDLAPGTYYYELEDVDLNGVTTRHGPVSATVMPQFRRPSYRPMWPGF